MAAYEILLLNTAIPQIQAAQSGDTYVVPRDIAFSTVANLANGTNLLPSLTFSSDTNTGIYREGADALGFTAGGGTNQMVLTSTGLGIGTSSPAQPLDVVSNSSANAISIRGRTADDIGTLNFSTNAGSIIAQIQSRPNGNELRFLVAGARSQTFYTNGSEQMRLDSSGNLGLGVTPSTISAGRNLEVGFAGSGIYSYSQTDTEFLSNAYYNVGYKFGGTGRAMMYAMGTAGSGIHSWHTSTVSGTANSASVTSGASYTVVALGSSTLAQWQAFFNDSSNNPLTVTPTLGQVLTGNATGTLVGGGLVTQNISFTQAMTLNASGNLGVGETNPGARLHVDSGSTGNYAIFKSTNANGGYAAFYSGSTVQGDIGTAAQIVSGGAATDFGVNARGSRNLIFGTNNTERARITSGGYFKASNNGTYADSTGGYHEFYQTNNTDTVRVTSTSTAVSGAYGVYVDLTTDPNATDSFFLRCYGGANQRASIRSNGGLANYQSNNVDLSDIRTKTDISPLASYWNKIAALEIVTYKYKDQTHDDLNIGVIAQQVEQVAPEFVDPDGFGETPEDGVPLKTIYNKDLTFAAIKALQEAMARIEKLEAEVAALKGA